MKITEVGLREVYYLALGLDETLEIVIGYERYQRLKTMWISMTNEKKSHWIDMTIILSKLADKRRIK